MAQPSERKPRTTRRWVLGIFGGIFLLIVFFCSGLNFPVLGPQRSFATAIHDDFRLTLPPSLKVTHAARCASRDPAYFYDCDIAPADIPLFKKQLEDAAQTAGYKLADHDSDTRFSFGPPPPSWYIPGTLTDRQAMVVRIENSSRGTSTGYWFFFSASTGKIYVFWYAT